MAINFRKLKKQVKKVKGGYRFIATHEQKLFDMQMQSSRTRFMKYLEHLASWDEDFSNVFKLNRYDN